MFQTTNQKKKHVRNQGILWYRKCSKPFQTSNYLVGGFNPSEKYESQWEGLSHILWKIKKFETTIQNMSEYHDHQPAQLSHTSSRLILATSAAASPASSALSSAAWGWISRLIPRPFKMG